MGSRKKTAKLANGSLPTARNRTRPQAMVSNTASTGENHAIHIDGCARGSSLNMCRLRGSTRPQAAHPLPDQVYVGIRSLDGGRRPALGDHNQAIGYLEQLVQLFEIDNQCKALLPQSQHQGAYLARTPNTTGRAGVGEKE